MAAHLLLTATPPSAPFSRNRNFEAFDAPRYKSAIALYRRLRALASDLERARVDGSSLAVVEETHAGRPSVRLEIIGRTSPGGGRGSRRTSWLERPAWEVLLLHPGARSAVATLCDRVAA